jgi:hypothetical protein
MTDYKFTDDDVMKALELCSKLDLSFEECDKCPYKGECGTKDGNMPADALALVNRQKAEIEKLNDLYVAGLESLRLAAEANKDMQAEIKRLQSRVNRLKQYDEERDIRLHTRLTANARAKAIKEFAERLKANMSNIARMEFGGNIYFCVGYDLIDTLVKEMTEEKENESKST